MSYMLGLKCRECGRLYPKEVIFVCEYCFGGVEVDYDYDAIRRVLTKDAVASRPKSLWRYRELLPIEGEPAVGLLSGFTPFFRSERLAQRLGVEELYLKDDSVSHPTLSFKDRVVSVALTRAKEFGFDTVACASTGNLANSVAALSARAGLQRYIFIPSDLEMGKVVGSLIYRPTLVAVEGTYDDVNRLCAEIGSKYPWAFVNINIRPYYAEGSKTYGFEVLEQMGWRAPQHIIVPCAGGSLITKINKAIKEFKLLGLIDPASSTKLYAAQADGCAPIVKAIKERSDIVRPVKPQTIAKSLAIGNPADGYYATRTALDSGGFGESVSDEEIIEAMRLLAETEGVFTETAGGVTVAVARKLIEQGVIPRDESIVVCITGNGLKTQEPLVSRLGQPVRIKPNLASFESTLAEQLAGLSTKTR
ncbi:MAG TPA: threonine synthase [Candidatus Omnitrophica bacterium]|nr:MAG: threonine synthase [Omnitrophica WOR_2 bacterium GWA2_63_20]OGX32372.1 MAG: threonine synthase [Omnitrophica WOR_2 bacterium RIFCSPHIGHO2_12_FULL_64_13]OGX36199.1 MAG: threonine synthase [Omnitrophica WOR_2 bacterium RIFCSPHIGHO2_02_FULL_63_39]OGX45608.1 MAG: threonine synthase [Omnitrophica WOR_2 bacterium RIFCSPLOWO2_02_FULL_63_16]OGX48491.1 MAG: threonine synthase [Omnitrophica WOR_2 bacterium RIFCSPLOWO2_12_FULL_63_16]HBH97719.1 threonine synthase [Candidatus Omnitrophota bacterium